jgi:agmatine/peptidylarginine deiminase
VRGPLSVRHTKHTHAQASTRGSTHVIHITHALDIPPKCKIQAEDGRANRHAGERLAASYANFYICNGGVIMPAFNIPESDDKAQKILQAAFPDKKVVAVQTREIVLGGGNVHCITQQQPRLP